MGGRESMIHSPLGRDMSTSVGQRMFPVPYSAPYHNQMLDPKTPGKWTAANGYDTGKSTRNPHLTLT